jgi:hypothetical protein
LSDGEVELFLFRQKQACKFSHPFEIQDEERKGSKRTSTSSILFLCNPSDNKIAL